MFRRAWFSQRIGGSSKYTFQAILTWNTVSCSSPSPSLLSTSFLNDFLLFCEDLTRIFGDGKKKKS